MALSDIANSSIVVGVTPVSAAGFTTMMVLGEHNAFAERFRTYFTPDGVAEDFDEKSAEYRAANVAFSQRNDIDRVIIGRRDNTDNVAQVDDLDITSVDDAQTLTVTFEGWQLFELTVETGEVLADFTARVLAAINASDAPITATDGALGGELVVTADWAGQGHTLEVGGTVTAAVTAGTANTPSGETVTAALGAIVDAGADFYGLTMVSRDEDDIKAATAWVETRPYKGGFRLLDADIIDAVDGDIVSELTGLERFKSWGFYHDRPWYFPEVALMANRLSVNPDNQATVWRHVRLAGVPPIELTENQLANIKTKNVFYNESVAGLNITMGGKTFAGEWVDVVVGIAHLNMRIAENAATTIISAANANRKIPYTNGGVAQLEVGLRKQLDNGVNTQFISDDEDYTVTAPRVQDLSSAQRASRELPPILWNAPIAGAIFVSNYSGELVP